MQPASQVGGGAGIRYQSSVNQLACFNILESESDETIYIRRASSATPPRPIVIHSLAKRTTIPMTTNDMTQNSQLYYKLFLCSQYDMVPQNFEINCLWLKNNPRWSTCTSTPDNKTVWRQDKCLRNYRGVANVIGFCANRSASGCHQS